MNLNTVESRAEVRRLQDLAAALNGETIKLPNEQGDDAEVKIVADDGSYVGDLMQSNARVPAAGVIVGAGTALGTYATLEKIKKHHKGIVKNAGIDNS